MAGKMEIMREMKRGGYRDSLGNGDREIKECTKEYKYSNSAPVY